MSNAIRIVAKDGKKLLVSWKQSSHRDQVFTKVLDAINNLEENGTNASSSVNGKTEKHKHKKEEEKKELTTTKTEGTKVDLTDSKAYSTWSRFDD